MKIASLASAAVLALAPTSCRKAEVVELASYPQTHAGFAIADVEGNPSVITLNATYDGQGVLTADGDITRTYIFTMESPSPEDAVFELEAIHEGLPAEYVELSTEKLTIPAGYKSASVDVTFTPEDLSFAAIEAETYEVGVRVKSMKAYQVTFEGEPEAKVVVEKMPYMSEASIVIDPSGAGSINFKRSYVDGEIINDDAMTFNFKAVLNRPALVDMEVPVSISGLPSGFDKCATFSEPTLKFAAGEKTSSNVITCDISDDFLLNGVEEPEAFALTVVADFSKYETGAMNESGALAVNVTKTLDLLVMVPASEFASLTKYAKSGWTATGDGYGTPGNLIDGTTSGYGYYYYFSWFQIDMKVVQPVSGIMVYPYYNSASYLPTEFSIEISEDGEKWLPMGEISNGTSAGSPAYTKFLKTVNARYIKYNNLGSTYKYIMEVDVYHN